MSFRLIPALASGALLLSCAAASAQTATASTNVNVRSGPGGQYSVIDRLPAGETVNILNCRGEWCEISMGGDSGFVARSYLDDGGRRSSARVVEYDDDYAAGPVVIERDDPDAVVGLSIGGYYESRPYYIREGYYYWGGRWYGRRPGVSGWRSGSWRRWEERRGPPRVDRGGRPPRVEERRARIERAEPGRDPRLRPMERRMPDAANRGPDRDGGSRAAVDRGERRDLGERRDPGERRDLNERRDLGERHGSEPARGPEINQRAERPEIGSRGGSSVTGGRGPDGGGRTPGAGSNDRGDRVGLDRAGGGKRDDR
ncbi:SH3 domain-containing protein [Methylopila sp. M107]|uniref:SH3 domain-containing protein n=1 Tax=Methylopila sp. M107 TaxID=1101190 RepID=UPI00036DED36|nr:SH3 domain-containing protein [Methylopila sp. M107]